jgi:deoxycytidine triphosphate deaminase
MMTASEIAVQIGKGEIAWPGEMRGDSLLLQLGSPIQPMPEPGPAVDLAVQDAIDTIYADPVHDWEDFWLQPGRMLLCSVTHPLRLGPRFAAYIGGLSHLARAGLAVHLASPWVMPGWDGHLTLELFNAGPAVLKLRQDMPAARAVLIRMDGEPGDPARHEHYGYPGHLGSRYAAEFGARLLSSGTGE